MKTNVSTYSALLAAQAEDAVKIDAWLEERFAEEDVQDCAEALADEKFRIREDLSINASYDTSIAPCQIRILSKRYTNEPWELPYVAVIEEWEPDNWLVVPYSKYKTPATPGEMATGNVLFGQSVLQAWNARTVQTRVLAKSFLVGALDEHVRQNAADLFRHELSGKALPATFDALTGPAVVYAADPRRDYIAECIARLTPLSTAVKVRAILDEMVEPVAEPVCPFWDDMALAAGNATAVTDTFIVEKDELSVEYSPEEKKVRMTVYDQNDQPNAVYDGYGVVGEDGEFLGVLRKGSMTVSSDALKGGFRLVDPNGEVVQIVKKGNRQQ